LIAAAAPTPLEASDTDVFSAPDVFVQILDPSGQVLGSSSNLFWLAAGAATMDQALPFQCSSTALLGYEARSGSAPPTAQTSLLEIAATALRERLMAEPDGVGEGTMLHALPFQCSARVA
jgi:hypothetical protein